jgi:hypothetical protein
MTAISESMGRVACLIKESPHVARVIFIIEVRGDVHAVHFGAPHVRSLLIVVAVDGQGPRSGVECGKPRAPIPWVGRAGPDLAVSRLRRGQFAGGGPAVAAVHVVHDGGEGARRLPGKPGHRVE